MPTKSELTDAPLDVISSESPTQPRETGQVTTQQRRMTLRDSTSIGVIAVLAAGGVLGAILGALNFSALVIGLLVAGVTVLLMAALRRYPRTT